MPVLLHVDTPLCAKLQNRPLVEFYCVWVVGRGKVKAENKADIVAYTIRETDQLRITAESKLTNQHLKQCSCCSRKSLGSLLTLMCEEVTYLKEMAPGSSST